MIDIIKLVAGQMNLKENQVKNTVELLDDGATVPFISRYRKEVTGSLNEEEIREISEKITYIRNLEKRKEEIIASITEQGKLTPELEKQIRDSVKLQEVEDLYLPYKKKKKTKADVAKENGLEPLYNFFMEKSTTVVSLKKKAEEFLNDKITDIEQALEGMKFIAAEVISENVKFREYIRNDMQKTGIISAKLIEKNAAKDEKKVYLDYYEYEEDVKKAASHRILALNRGESEEILRVAIKPKDAEKYIQIIGASFENKNLAELIREIVIDSLDRLILPSIEREVRNILTESAEKDAIHIFKTNLKNLLMQPPIYNKTILGIDPGYRTGCKLAVISKLGFPVEIDVMYLHEERNAISKIISLIKKHEIDIVVIGNGTASRETEKLVADIIRNNEFNKKVFYMIVNEAGASVYSASKLAKDEFPDLDVTARGTISISRRVQDPLAELVKIDPKSIGVGMYQHDVNQKQLTESLTDVVESVVNNVGVNINTASYALLEYVSGMKKDVAKNIVEYRNKNGKFKTRKELKEVKGVGEKLFTLAAGFIVVPESDNPLDNTIIHPESYNVAEKILATAGFKLKDLKESLGIIRDKLKTFDIDKFVSENGVGKETAQDIYNALVKDRRDPRESMPQPLLKEDILKIEDLKDGMTLEGTVRNVLSFGAFIDIGLKNDALLHISEFGGTKFIKDPTQVMAVGDIVKVIVKGVDIERGRVSLTMKGL